MALRIKCKCGTPLAIPAKLAGKVVKCPNCEKPFRISVEKFNAIAGRRRANATGSQSSIFVTDRPTPEPADLTADIPQLDPTLPDKIKKVDSLDRPTPPRRRDDAQTFATASSVASVAGAKAGGVCPCCGNTLPALSKICIKCGINIKTGRSLLTTDDGRVDAAYVTAESVLRWFSWISWFGVLPIASEAFGTRKPHVIRAIAMITILITCWFWCFDWSGSVKMRTYKNLILWAGDAGPNPVLLYLSYKYEHEMGITNWGDSSAFWVKLDEVTKRAEEAKAAGANGTGSPNNAPPANAPTGNQGSLFNSGLLGVLLEDMPDPDLIVEAHNELGPKQQCTGQFHTYQLLTNAFLHGGILHLLGNLLFLMVFGSRVNALIGNIPAVILYPILAIAGSIGHLLSATDMTPHPALGASGAIMGLAGIYLVLFPLHKVHMAAWWRWGLIGAFRLHMKMFGVRGFWVVLFYIAFDVLFTIWSVDDGVAHWAHLGGFIAGVVLALVLLCSHLINARGGDILSAIFGRHAWALVGRPGRN